MADIGVLSGLDPKNLSPEEYAELVYAASAVAVSGGMGLSALDPKQFAWIVSRASTEQIAEVMSHPKLRG